MKKVKIFFCIEQVITAGLWLQIDSDSPPINVECAITVG